MLVQRPCNPQARLGSRQMLPETQQPSHHAKEAEGETWLCFIGWVMEGGQTIIKGDKWVGATYESPLACPPQWRRETSLFPRVSGISGLSPPMREACRRHMLWVWWW